MSIPLHCPPNTLASFDSSVNEQHCLVQQNVSIQLPTRWAKDVTPENVWAEYPRPQMRRQQWDNLNGMWELEEVTQLQEDPPFGKTLSERVLVPFPIESELSGTHLLDDMHSSSPAPISICRHFPI